MPPDPNSGRRGPPPPFDLDGLDRVINKNADPLPDPNRKWWTPWRRHDRSQPPPQMLRESRPTATRAILALAPGPDLAEAIRVALARADAPRRVGPRIVMRSELAIADADIWEPAIAEVARAWKPFAVRLVKAEIVRDRMLGLVVGGQAVLELHAAIEEALALAGFPDRSGMGFLPMVIVGTTFDGLTVHELHAVAAAIREHLTFPIEFPASSVLRYSESADEYDLPVAAYPLLG
jgi:hypothetical protein